MAEQTFGPGELLVVAEGDTVDFSVQVHGRAELRHDEVRELIAFLQNVVGAEPEQELTPGQLDALPVGSEVYDVDGDMWTKRQDQRWQWESYSPRTSHYLVDTYGPIRAK